MRSIKDVIFTVLYALSVSPCFVDVVVVDAQGVSTEILKVLRC